MKLENKILLVDANMQQVRHYTGHTNTIHFEEVELSELEDCAKSLDPEFIKFRFVVAESEQENTFLSVTGKHCNILIPAKN